MNIYIYIYIYICYTINLQTAYIYESITQNENDEMESTDELETVSRRNGEYNDILVFIIMMMP